MHNPLGRLVSEVVIRKNESNFSNFRVSYLSIRLLLSLVEIIYAKQVVLENTSI